MHRLIFGPGTTLGCRFLVRFSRWAVSESPTIKSCRRYHDLVGREVTSALAFADPEAGYVN